MLYLIPSLLRSFAVACGRLWSPVVFRRSHVIVTGGVERCYDTIRYDTRCYFNVRAEADTGQFNLRTEPTTKSGK